MAGRHPVLPQGNEQPSTEHNVTVLAALAAADVNDPAPAVDVAQLEAKQLGSARAGGVERHQDRAVKRAVGGVDPLGDFLRTQDARESAGDFRVRRQIHTPRQSERLGVEESQRRQPLLHRVVGRPAVPKQVGLLPANVLGPQTVGRSLEVTCELLDRTDVDANGARGVVATLEFLEHHLA